MSETPASLDDGKNRCGVCATELPPQVNEMCEACRDLAFGTVEGNQALAGYYQHRADHPGCDCP